MKGQVARSAGSRRQCNASPGHETLVLLSSVGVVIRISIEKNNNSKGSNLCSLCESEKRPFDWPTKEKSVTQSRNNKVGGTYFLFHLPFPPPPLSRSFAGLCFLISNLIARAKPGNKRHLHLATRAKVEGGSHPFDGGGGGGGGRGNDEKEQSSLPCRPPPSSHTLTREVQSRTSSCFAYCC